MKPELFYYVNLVLCIIVLVEILVTFRKNVFLNSCFLLIIACLFVMNYFAATGVTTRLQFVLAKSMRLIYVCSTLLSIVYLVTPKIPRWLIALISLAALTITALRLIYYDQINIEALAHLPNQVFDVGAEFYAPKAQARIIIFSLAGAAIVIAFYYYRLYLLRLNWESADHRYLSRWMMSLIIPFFLLTIFGILGNLNCFNQTVSSYLFSLFSFMIILSILLRPHGSFVTNKK